MNLEYLDIKECDSSVKTQVLVGRSAKNKGWSLNIKDISNFIPVKKYEFNNCKIIIEDMVSDCRIRINPRLFFLGSEISDYLSQLNKDSRIPLEIKYNKSYLNKQLENWNKKNLKYIDTKLLVGKSFSSKGWVLSEDVRALLFPVFAYKVKYPITVGKTQSFARLEIYMRLFYKSKKLSNELKKLHDIDPNQKINARIVFDEKTLPNNEKTLYEFNLKSESINEKSILKDYISGVSIDELCKKYSCDIKVIENLIIRFSDGEFDDLF